MKRFVVLDLGTGGIHVNLVDEKGNVLSGGYEEVVYKREDAALSFDPDALFNRTIELARRVCAGSVQDLRGVVITGQRHGCVFLDADDRPILAAPNIDPRAQKEANSLSGEFRERVYGLTARWPGRQFPALRFRWLKEERPSDYEKVRSLMMVNEYIAFRLTGVKASEHTNAAETLLYGVKERAWSDELIGEFANKDFKPNPLRQNDVPVGRVSEPTARKLGTERLPVYLAVADTQAAMLGSGALHDGDVVVINGSTTPVTMVVPNLIQDAGYRVICNVYYGNRWMLESNCTRSGMVYRKLMNDLSDFLKALDLETPSREHIEKVFSAVSLPDSFMSWMGPVLAGQYSGCNSSGVLEGASGVNLFLSLIPSYTENLAFAILANTEQLAEITQIQPRRIILTGGGSVSRPLLSVLSGILPADRFFVTADTETTSRGAFFSISPKAFESGEDLNIGLNAVECVRDSALLEKYKRWKKHFN